MISGFFNRTARYDWFKQYIFYTLDEMQDYAAE